jgi:hypothetical protein
MLAVSVTGDPRVVALCDEISEMLEPAVRV